MKFKINKEHLATGLKQVTNVVSSKPQMAILNNVLIKAENGSVMLTTTNLELGIRCSIKAEVEEAGEITLPVKKLAAIVNALPQQEVSIESADGQTARIRSGRSDFNRFNGLKAEDFPALPSFVNQHSYELPPQELALMLRSVSYAQSTDENRYILNSVFFNFSEGKLSLVATDGRRLALISREMKIDQQDEGSIILPAKTVTELEKLLAQGKMVKISFSERQVAFDIEVGEDSANNGLNGSIIPCFENRRRQLPELQAGYPQGSRTQNQGRARTNARNRPACRFDDQRQAKFGQAEDFRKLPRNLGRKRGIGRS